MAHLINTRIAVFWPAEKAWFAGKVTKYDAKETAHHIVYDDGNLEWRDLKQFKWRKEKKKAAAKKKKKKAKKRGRRATKKKGGEPTAAAATPAPAAARVAAAAAPAARPKAVVEKPEPDAKRRRTAASASSPRASPIAFAEADVTIGVTGDDSLLEQRATTDDDVAESDDADAALAQQLFGGAAEEEAEASKEKEKQKMPELFPPIEENREADAFAREASRASLLAMLHTRQTEIEHSPMRSAVKPRSVAQPAAALRPILVTFSASTSDADEEEEDTGSIADDDGEADVDLEEEEAAAAGDDVVALRTTDADRAFFVRAGAPAPAAPFAWRAPLLSSSSAAPVPAAAAAAPQQRQFQAHLQPSSTMAGRRRTSMQQPLLSPLGTLSSERAERRRGEKGLTGILKPTSASLDTRRGGSSSSSGAAAISSHQAPLSRFGCASRARVCVCVCVCVVSLSLAFAVASHAQPSSLTSLSLSLSLLPPLSVSLSQRRENRRRDLASRSST